MRASRGNHTLSLTLAALWTSQFGVVANANVAEVVRLRSFSNVFEFRTLTSSATSIIERTRVEIYLIVCLIAFFATVASAYEPPIERLPAIEALPYSDSGNRNARLASGFSNDTIPGELDGLSRQPPAFVYPGALPNSRFEDEFYELPSTRLSPYKDGFFQKLAFSGAWLDGGRVDDLSITELKLSLTVALPLPTRDHPLLITPGFETRFLHGPITPDLPGQVYSAYVQMLWVPKLSQRWKAVLGFEPGSYSDFEQDDDDALRLLGRALLLYDWRPDRLQLVFGVLHLDRDDVNLLPAGGVIWTPTDNVRYEVIFPKPKLAHRLSFDGVRENWVFVAGEFGGDTWAVQRANGMQDRLTLRDLRVTLGLERKRDGGAGATLEVGYIFGRTVEYRTTTPDLNLGDTFMLRGGVAY